MACTLFVPNKAKWNSHNWLQGTLCPGLGLDIAMVLHLTVDDAALIAIGPDFEATHHILQNMLEQRDGSYDWSRDHNSKFKTSKFTLIDTDQ